MNLRTRLVELRAEQRITTEIEHLDAQIEDAKDQRRQYEWAIRERLVAALERRGLPIDDDGFDPVADEANWRLHTVDLEPPF